MVASPKPQPFGSSSDDPRRAAPAFAGVPAGDVGGGSGGGSPGTPERTIHNEITKLKANTVNAAAIAFFIGGGVGPLIGIGVTGFTVLQAVMVLVWFFVGLVLHSMAQTVLGGLLP